jgi:hypothetical protein
VRFNADVTLDQEEREETIRNGLKAEAHKGDLLPRLNQIFGCLKATSASLSNCGSHKFRDAHTLTIEDDAHQ